MAIPVIMPRQGQSVESCIITKWNKKKGDKVNIGDVLFSYETDKASFEEEAKAEGILLEIFFEEGDDVPCLMNVCVIGNEGESTAEFNPKGAGSQDGSGKQAADAGAKAQTSADAGSNNETKAAQGGISTDSTEAGKPVAGAAAAPAGELPLAADIKISPRARQLAAKTGVDIRFAVPSGPNGRIIERDIAAMQQTGPFVTPAAREEYLKAGAGQLAGGTGIGGRITTSDLAAAAAASAASQASAAPQNVAAQIPQADYREVKLTNIRKVIAKSMQHSLSSTAQLTLNSSFDATEILAFRKRLKDNREAMGLANITLNDIILYAVSRTLLKHEGLNAHFVEDKMLMFNNAHLGIAVDTERGLMVPTLFNANKMSLNDISLNAKKLIDDCQKGTINPDLLKGASFTITNLGSLDIESFTPVLNPPQTGILGVDNITWRTKQVNGEFVTYPAMGLSLTFDHRAVDGAPAAKFLKDLRIALENFSMLLAK